MTILKDTEHNSSGLIRFTYILISLIATITILVYTEEYIVPFILAMIIWFIIHELRENLQMIPWVKRKVPIWVQSTIAFVFINVVIAMAVQLIYYHVSRLASSAELYAVNFQKVLEGFNDISGINIADHINDSLDQFDVGSLAASTLDYMTSLLSDGFLILIYVVFLLVEESIFPFKLRAFYPNLADREKKEELFYKMDQNIGRYFRLKTLVSFITGGLSYIVLLIIGVEAALFWAFLIFILNFIPTIGSLIATVFPAIFAIFQMAELAPFIYVILSVGAVQIVVGNILEPKIMGNSLNLSSLVVVLSLTIWGAIWGVTGMILSVPITVLMMIIFEEIPSLKFIAVALSERGELSKSTTKPK